MQIQENGNFSISCVCICICSCVEVVHPCISLHLHLCLCRMCNPGFQPFIRIIPIQIIPIQILLFLSAMLAFPHTELGMPVMIFCFLYLCSVSDIFTLETFLIVEWQIGLVEFDHKGHAIAMAGWGGGGQWFSNFRNIYFIF